MTGWPDRPVIYEINTAVWLNGLARAAGRRVTLAGVAAADWDAVTPPGVDAVWLMGVWERSPAGLALANANAGLQASYPMRCRTFSARMSSDRRTACAATRPTRPSAAPTRWPWRGPPWLSAARG